MGMDDRRHVIVVEDDPFLGGLLAEILEVRGFRVHHAADGSTAMALIEEHDPDALIVDLDLGRGPSGLDVIAALGDRLPEFGVLVLSNYPTVSTIAPGATLPSSVGHLLKRRVSNADEVVRGLEAVLANAAPRNVGLRETVPEELGALTPGQFELLRLVALGHSNEMIATHRGVTVRSVETLLSRLFSALGFSTDDPRGNPRVKAAMLYARTMGVPRTDA